MKNTITEVNAVAEEDLMFDLLGKVSLETLDEHEFELAGASSTYSVYSCGGTCCPGMSANSNYFCGCS